MQQQKCVECGGKLVDTVVTTDDGCVALARCQGCGCGQPIIAESAEELKARLGAAVMEVRW
jgi:hypothetical protein